MNGLEFLLSDRPAARVILVLALGAFYAGAILINNELLFPFTEVDGTVFWFFFPEGIKFLLVLSLGVRGALAVGIGRAVVTLNEYPDAGYVNGLATGAVMAISTLAALRIGSSLTGTSFPWQNIKPHQIALMALVFALTDTTAKIFYEINFLANAKILDSGIAQLFAIEAFGRFFGIVAFVYLVSTYQKVALQRR